MLVEPHAPDPAWLRHAPHRILPPYRFIPTVNPHPRRDPQGHSFGKPEPKPPYVPPDRWKENEVYLQGVDLYNFAYWWECHETWEALWHLTGHTGWEALFLQGLIQNAAANIKRHVGQIEGARHLAEQSIDKLHRVCEKYAVYMGLELALFISEIEEWHLRNGPRPALIRLR